MFEYNNWSRDTTTHDISTIYTSPKTLFDPYFSNQVDAIEICFT